MTQSQAQAQQLMPITVIDDAIVEANEETFTITLTTINLGTTGRTPGAVTIDPAKKSAIRYYPEMKM